MHLPSKIGSYVKNSILTKDPYYLTKLPTEIRTAKNVKTFCNKLKGFLTNNPNFINM